MDGGKMAEVSAKWWGIIVSLNHEEGCGIATGSSADEALLNALPSPWGPFVFSVVKTQRDWIGRTMGSDGVDLHINVMGFLQFVGSRGDPRPCTGATLGTLI
jgi:hypothetical protein